jgi:glyoxylase-like metal-dependent hydrolase (beta-lactamase superfamily II)
MTLSVADLWYQVEVLSKDVTLITEPHINTAAVGNIWLLKGSDRSLVFDTGTGLGDIGTSIASLTEKPVIAIASTGYYDHAGGLNQFEHRAVHSLEAERVSNPTPRNTVSDKYLMQTSLDALPYVDFRAKDYVMRECVPTQLLNDGDRINIGNRSFDVLHTPGITAGSIVLYEEQTGFLFSGESVSSSNFRYTGEPADETDDADKSAFRKSMVRLLDLNVSMVYPGHRLPFDAGRLHQVLKQYLDL